MENDNLKSLWKSVQNNELNKSFSLEINVDEIIKQEHGKVMTKMHYGAMKELIVSSVLMIIWIGLLLYAYVYLSLRFSVITNLMFGVIFLFLLFSLLMGLNKYYLIRKENNSSTIKESFLSFRKRWIRANMAYLVVLTTYLYLLMAQVIFGIIGEFKGISQSEVFFPILSVILMVAGIPWLLRLEIKHRYRKLFRNLDESLHTLSTETS